MKAFGNIEKDSQVRAVASGAISSGKPVVINSDGTVSEVSGADEALGSIVAANSLVSGQFTTVFDSSNNKHVIVYRTSSNMRYVVATIASDGGVTLGTDAVAEASDNQQIAGVFDSTNNRIVVAYRRGDDSDHGHCLVGSLSGTTVTWGSPTEFNNAANTGISLSFDTTAGKGVVSYKNGGNSNYGTARVFTVSGTSISFGTAVVFNSGSTDKTRSVYDSTNNKIVIGFSDDADSSKGKAVVGTISGTDITFGSEVQFEQGKVDSHSAAAFDSDTGKVVFAYRQNASSGGSTDFKRGTAVVGTVSGDTISFGTPVAFDNTGDYGENTPNGAVYDSNAKKVLVVYPRTIEGSYSNRGHVFPLKVSGTTIVADTPNNFNGAATAGFPAISFDTNVNKSLIAFRHDSNEYASAVSYSPGSTTLTSENYIGMLSGVAVRTGSAASVGTAVQFDSNVNAADVNVVYDTNSDRIVIDYRDTDNSNYHTAVVGTVNSANNSISFGTPVVYSSHLRSYGGMTFDSTNNKVVIAFRLGNESDADYRKGFGIVGTVDPSDNSISFGSATKFEDAQVEYMSAAFDSNAGKVVFAYVDNGNSAHGTAIVGTVSGTSISFGTAAVFNAGGTVHSEVVFDSTNNKVVFAYRDSGNSSYLTGIVGTVSGTSISFGSETAANNFDSREVGLGFAGSGKVVAVVRKDSDGSGHAYVGTVSGTSISFGSAVSVNGTSAMNRSRVLLDESTGRVVIAYDEQQNSSKGVFVSGDVSGTSITLTSATTFEAGNVQNAIGAAYDPDGERVVLAFADGGDSSKGKAVVAQTDSIATTRAQIANGGKAVIDSTNAISRNQIGLTAGQTLYVQTDGTLSETADDPSVTAGTAISATELIVKG